MDTPSEPTRPKSPYKCPAHNMWMRKGQCEICRLELDKRTRAAEQQHGSNKQEVIIKKV